MGKLNILGIEKQFCQEFYTYMQAILHKNDYYISKDFFDKNLIIKNNFIIYYEANFGFVGKLYEENHFKYDFNNIIDVYCENIYKGSYNVLTGQIFLKPFYDDLKNIGNDNKKIIQVRKLCKFKNNCPSLKYLSKKQLELWNYLQNSDIENILKMDWSIVYPTLKTFKELGLIIYNNEIVSSDMLKNFKIIEQIEKTCNCYLEHEER